MLSILIPTYNYSILPLVLELKQQCDGCTIDYEIIGLDDGSDIVYKENEEINSLEHCSFRRNATNSGRSSSINALAGLAKHDYILILEADALPTHKNYIQRYVSEIKIGKEAVFGGVVYSKVKPSADSRLRWVYGHERESRSLKSRSKNPYDIVFTWNLLIRKDIFFRSPFDTAIKTYGFEDLVFLKGLGKQRVEIHHIQNECMHLNDEKSMVFIQKYHSSLKNLKRLLENNTIHAHDTPLTQLYNRLQKVKLGFLISGVFRVLRKPVLKNLASEKPSLLLFDFYKLGYFCTLMHNPLKETDPK